MYCKLKECVTLRYISIARREDQVGGKIIVTMYRRAGAYIGYYYGSGAGLIWLDDLQCTGSESSLVNCTHRGWRVHDCDHNRDASIVCGEGRLFTLVGFLYVVNEYETHYNEESQNTW